MPYEWTYEWHDLLGNLGVACVLGTYLMLQLGRMSSMSLVYGGLNATGAVLILVSLTQNFNLSSFVIEICWLAISLVGLYRGVRANRAHDTASGLD